MDLRFMTYNIQHGEDFAKRLAGQPEIIDLSLIANVIREYQPDVVGLNEVRDWGAWEDYFEETKMVAEMLGYPYYYFAKAIDFYGCGQYGNAIISKYPMKFAWTVPIPDPAIKTGKDYETRCVLKAQFEIPARFDVLISHFGLNASEKLNAVSTVRQLLGDSEVPTVFMGDLNMRPGDAKLAPLYEVMQDTGELLAPGSMSWPSNEPRAKIDYVFATKEFSVRAAEIPVIVASDHCPYVADLSL